MRHLEHKERLENAWHSLEGLSTGDALGDQYFIEENDAIQQISMRMLPKGLWKYTDDTLMSASIVDVLRQHGEIDQDELSKSFVDHLDMSRGYGAGALRQLIEIQNGENWKKLTYERYGGMGSAGNGSAMRVAPIGAYFHDDLDKVVEQARLSSEVTHTNREAIAGATTIALASAIACQCRNKAKPTRQEFIRKILPHIPKSEMLNKLYQAYNLPKTASVQLAVSALGNGKNLLAIDTVPFAIWCASGNLDDFEEAFWITLSGLGDRDTNCAIVCGIVACSVDIGGIPNQWIQSRESLPSWIYESNEPNSH